MFFTKLVKQIMERQDQRSAEEVEFLRARLVALEDSILEMKKVGFESAAPVTQTFQRDLLSDTIMGAIDASAREGTTLHADLLDFGRAQRLLGRDDEEIADRIMSGGSAQDFD